MAREASPERVFNLVAEELARVHGVAGGAVVRFDDGEAAFVGRWSARPGAWPRADLTVPLTDPLPSIQVAHTGRPARADDFRAFAGAVPWVLDPRAFRGSVAAPVRVGDHLWGAVIVATDGTQTLPPDTERRLARFAELVSLAIGNAEVRAELAWRAATDALTGLVNRGVFEERLAEEVARSRRHGRDLSLAVLDLDMFKAVNDTHGHVVGDAVLREAALRLSSRVREGDVLARIGGEEFAWLMPETDGMEAWQATERARAAMSEAPFPEVGRVTVSGGVCDLERADGPEELYRQADAALYWAKRNGRDVVFLYTPEAMEALGEEERAAELRRNQAFQSIRVLARAVDAKDPSTRRHSERVAALAESLAADAGLGAPSASPCWARWRSSTTWARSPSPTRSSSSPRSSPRPRWPRSSLHSVLGRRDALGRAHARAGLVGARPPRALGRPGATRTGWRGEAVPEGARILHLADAWDVMTSSRPYVAPMTPEVALAECRRLAGAQFWEAAVTALEVIAESGGLAGAEVAHPAVLERL